jgi:SAM-dependent methyltransferase
METADFPAGSFDLAFLGDVIEHVPSPELTVRRVREWLKPGGLLVMRTPSVRGGFARASAAIARTTGTQWAHAEAPYHLTEFSPDGLRRLLERSGFETLVVSGSGRVPFAYRVGASGYLDELKADLKRREKSRVRLLLLKLPTLVGVTCLVGAAQVAGCFMGGMQSMTVVGRRR